MRGKRRRQTVYRVVHKQKRWNGSKVYYWQRKAAEAQAENTEGELLSMTGYWRPVDEDPDIIYSLYDRNTDTLLGLFTDKGRLIEAVEQEVNRDHGDTPWKKIDYAQLTSEGSTLDYYAIEVKVNELFYLQ